MALTRNFKETVQARVQRDPKFRENLITEAAGCLLAGDVETGKTILRDYINATVGFEKLGAAVHKSPKSLMRMFGEKGNPQAQNLFSIFAYIQKKEKIKLAVHPNRPNVWRSLFAVEQYPKPAPLRSARTTKRDRLSL